MHRKGNASGTWAVGTDFYVGKFQQEAAADREPNETYATLIREGNDDFCRLSQLSPADVRPTMISD